MKRITKILGITVMVMVIAIGFVGCPEEEKPNDFNIVGTYSFILNNNKCTWVFNSSDKTYEIDRPNLQKISGTWSVSGKEITLKTDSAVGALNETFTISEDGDNVTLTFKGNAQVSMIFTNISVVGKSLTLMREAVANPFIVVSVSVSPAGTDNTHNLAIREDGTLWAWGDDTFGQLGLSTGAYTPTQVGTATNWESILAANLYTFAIRKDGTLWAWGYNTGGGLGLGDTTDRDTPTQVGTATNWESVWAGNKSILAIRKDGTLWAWGRGSTPTQIFLP